MPRTVSFDTLVLEHANLRTQGTTVFLDVVYHLEDSSSGKGMGPYTYSIDSQQPASVLTDAFANVSLPPTPNLADVMLALRDYIHGKLKLQEGI
ncbi:MAG: hypothetical protein HYU29_04730 [Chloroflexi bacterium]|nr:hypothetical protein [Chloroflexota bacterium]